MKHEVVSSIVALLKEQLPPNLYALDLTQEQYLSILKKLQIHNDTSLFETKKGALKKAFSEYFLKFSNQEIEVEVRQNDFFITKRFDDPKRPEAFDRILHRNAVTLLSLKEHKNDYAPLPFLLAIPTQYRNEIIKGYDEIGENIETARVYTRIQFQNIFNLKERDIIFFLNEKIYVRYFIPIKKSSESSDKRFAGESPENMEALYAKYFPDGAWEQIEPVLSEVLEQKLNFSVINNAIFTQTFIPVFRGMIDIILLEILDPSERNKLEGFTGYVLRQSFDNILHYCAKNLLEYVELRDKNAEQFIKYYNEEVIIDASGNKVQKHAIIDAKKQRWNFSAILSIMMQYKQSKKRIELQKEAVAESQERLNVVQKEVKAEKENQKTILAIITDVESLLSENDTMLLDLNARKDDPTFLIQQKSLNNRHKELLDRKKQENTKLDIINGKISAKFSEESRHQKKLKHEQGVLKSLYEQMKNLIETYDLISQAVASVLAKR